MYPDACEMFTVLYMRRANNTNTVNNDGGGIPLYHDYNIISLVGSLPKWTQRFNNGNAYKVYTLKVDVRTRSIGYKMDKFTFIEEIAKTTLCAKLWVSKAE